MTLSTPTTPITPAEAADAALRGCDSGISFTMRRRSLLMAGFGLGAAGLVAACGSSGEAIAAGSSGRGGGSSSGSASAAASRAASSPEYHEASASNTPLSAGTWSGTIGDKQVTLSGAYLVDGTTATIDGGTFESATADQAVFLVVNGGRLTINNARIAKTGDATSSGQHGVDDSYSFYGLNSAVVVVGQGSSVTVSETTLTTDASGANAVVATGSASATVTSCAIATTGESSRGLHATYAGVITETQGVPIVPRSPPTAVRELSRSMAPTPSPRTATVPRASTPPGRSPSVA